MDQLYGGDFMKFGREFVDRNKGKVYDQIHGGCALIKRRAIQEDIGMCDPDFAYLLTNPQSLGGQGSNDIDMWIRVANAGQFTVTCFDSFAHHVVCGTTRQNTKEYKYNGATGALNIMGGNRLMQKWESNGQEIVYPFDVAGKKAPHLQFQRRKIPLQGDPAKLDWGLPGEIGKKYMLNWGREDAFPL